ncbi:damage-inducible protein DinB [Niastella vici]|uniref:Damage-inducible protein DinB n=1 Tax=Niastella vici TaxID=1703345 RepID=A0A1V9FMZ4_9BACT|nr:DinB family protein [Niastella vici]OQP59723.1 damage-inducible protein DinB [Niastella vici]
MTKKYRTGAIGALLDEYERAISDLKRVIAPVSDRELVAIVDPHTNDDNCRSIQTILTHVVHSGYGYATSIYNLKGYNKVRPEKKGCLTIAEYLTELDGVIVFTENVFGEFTDNDLEEFNNDKKIKAGWGQVYDIEQMMEHAIVHILRHRRQLEKFKEKLGVV